VDFICFTLQCTILVFHLRLSVKMIARWRISIWIAGYMFWAVWPVWSSFTSVKFIIISYPCRIVSQLMYVCVRVPDRIGLWKGFDNECLFYLFQSIILYHCKALFWGSCLESDISLLTGKDHVKSDGKTCDLQLTGINVAGILYWDGSFDTTAADRCSKTEQQSYPLCTISAKHFMHLPATLTVFSFHLWFKWLAY